MREGALKQEEEKLLFVKCGKDQKEAIEGYFAKNHPYETPELLRMHPEHVNDAYKERVKNSTKVKKNKKS